MLSNNLFEAFEAWMMSRLQLQKFGPTARDVTIYVDTAFFLKKFLSSNYIRYLPTNQLHTSAKRDKTFLRACAPKCVTITSHGRGPRARTDSLRRRVAHAPRPNMLLLLLVVMLVFENFLHPLMTGPGCNCRQALKG